MILTPPMGPLSLLLLVLAGTVLLVVAVVGLVPRDHGLIAKAVWRAALSLHGITHAQLARILGVSVATIDAALSDARENAIPLWWVFHGALPETVRAYVLAEIVARTSDAVAPPDTPEALTQVALVRVGHLVTTLGTLLTPGTAWRIGTDVAAQAIRQIGDTMVTLGGLSKRLHRRVITGAHAATKGAR